MSKLNEINYDYLANLNGWVDFCSCSVDYLSEHTTALHEMAD